MKSVLLLLVPLLCLCGVHAVNDTTLVTAPDLNAVNDTMWVYAKDFPDPQKNFTECGRDKPSWICDPSHHLTNEQGDELDDLINSFSGVPRCLCEEVNFCPDTFHHIIMVAIIPHMQGDIAQSVSEYAQVLQNVTWKEHHRSCSIFGVLVFDVQTKHGILVLEEQTVHDLPHYNMTGDGRYVEGGQVFEAAKAVLEEIKGSLADHTYLTTGGIVGIVITVLICGIFLVVCAVKVYATVTGNKDELLANDFVETEHEAALAEN